MGHAREESPLGRSELLVLTGAPSWTVQKMAFLRPQATPAPLPPLLWAPNAKQCYEGTDVSKINPHKINGNTCQEFYLQCVRSSSLQAAVTGGCARQLICTPSGRSCFDWLPLCGRGSLRVDVQG